MQPKTKRWIKRILVGSTLAVLLGAGLTVYLLQRPPTVWTTAQSMLNETTPAEREALAQDVMRRLSTAADGLLAKQDPRSAAHFTSDPSRLNELLTGQTVDETFQIELSNEELLAVASQWSQKWIEQRGYEPPAQMGDPIVALVDGELMIAFEVSAGSWQQVFSGRAEIRFDPDGMAHGSVHDFTAGSLPVPIASVGDWIAKQLPENQSEYAAQIGDWVSELEDFEFRPVLELEHRRRARITAMQKRETSLLLTMRLQDHRTYKAHNGLMKSGAVAVTDELNPLMLDGSAIADVPTTTE